MLEALEHISGSSPVGVYHDHFGPHGLETELVGFQWEPDPECRQELTEAIETYMQPMSDVEIMQRLMKLWAITKHAKSTGQDMDIIFESYVERLREYPGDLVHTVLMGRTYEWFPAWSELAEYLEWKVKKRRLLHRIVELDPTDKVLKRLGVI